MIYRSMEPKDLRRSTPQAGRQPARPPANRSAYPGRMDSVRSRDNRDQGRRTRPVPPPHAPHPERRQSPQFMRSVRAMCFKLVLAGLILVALLLAFSLYLKNRYQPDIVSLDTAARQSRDAVLVFGCGIYADGSPTPMLQDRVQTGVDAYFKGAGKKLILSGDHGQKAADEVNTMRQLALAAGVPEADIFIDAAGFSTYDSVKRSKDVFGAESLCLVTQRYHLYRALYLADCQGQDVCGLAANPRSYRGQFWRDCREVLARGKDGFMGLFQPDAEIMQPTYDLTGDGHQTWD